MRQDVGQHLVIGHHKDLEAEEQVEERAEQEDHAHQRKQPVAHGIQIAHALQHGQAGTEQRVLQDQHLHHAGGPAAALRDEGGEGFRLQPGDHRVVEIQAFPAARMDVERGFGVFGDGPARDAAHIVQRLAPDQRGGAAEERAAQPVQPAMDFGIEHLVFRGAGLGQADIALDRIAVGEEMRGLDQKQLGVLDKIPGGAGQKFPARHVVGIKDQHQLAAQLLQRGVEIARLGVFVARTGGVDHAHLLAHGLQLRAPLLRFLGGLGIGRGAFLVGAAIVAEHHGLAALGVDHLHGRRQRHRQQFGRFVIAWHQHVDGGRLAAAHAFGQRRRGRIGGDEGGQEEQHHGEGFRPEQHQCGDEGDRILGRGQGFGQTPEPVAQHQRAGGGQHEKAHAQAFLHKGLQGEEDRQHGQGQQRLHHGCDGGRGQKQHRHQQRQPQRHQNRDN